LSALPSSIVPDVNAEIEKMEDESDQYQTATFLNEPTEETEVVTDDG